MDCLFLDLTLIFRFGHGGGVELSCLIDYCNSMGRVGYDRCLQVFLT